MKNIKKTFENDMEVFKKGDIIIVNDHLKHYAGELMIVLTEIKATAEYNQVGGNYGKNVGNLLRQL